MSNHFKSLPTLTIGIPAHNEEGNIEFLLQSIRQQDRSTYTLEKVLLVCDGCTDRTVEKAKAFQSQLPELLIIERADRSGKANALNFIYDSHHSDYLLTLDADIVFEKDDDVSLLVEAITSDPELQMVGPRHIPVAENNFWAKCAAVSYRSFEDAFLQLYEGNNFYAVMSATLLTKALSKSFRYPVGTVSDQNYVYAKAIEQHENGFKLVPQAHVLFRTVSTFQDWRVLGIRSVIGDKADARKHFGTQINKRYTMPKSLYVKSLLKWLLHSPLYTLGAIGLNVFIRVFPYQAIKPADGMWQATQSSKKGITLSS